MKPDESSTAVDPESRPQQLAYLCLQATHEGQASYAHVHEIIAGLKTRGWDVRLFEPGYVKSSVLPGAFGRLLAMLKAQAEMWFSHARPDVLYIRSHYAALPSVFAAKLFGVPVIYEVNGPYEDLFLAWPWTRRFGPLFKAIYRTQFRLVDALITVTPDLADWLTKESGKTAYVIPNGANIKVFHPGRFSNVDLPRPYVVFFGALAPWQGIDTILSAVDCPEWPENVHLVVVGEGSERPKVELAASQNARITYLGKLPYDEISGIVTGSIAGLSPQNDGGGRSYSGLFPLKVFETLACGVPVIVTDFPGQADLVRETKSGIVIPPSDASALASAVRQLFAQPDEAKKMGHQGRKAVEEGHSWDKRAADTDTVLRKHYKG